MSITKYLARYAEPALPGFEGLVACGPWAHALVVPARRESIECLGVVARPRLRARLVCVLVVNAADEPRDQRAGVELLERIASAHARRWCVGGAALYDAGSFDLLTLDHCSGARAFSSHEGVGLARKIGADLLLRLGEAGALRSEWLHGSDADARLPAEHFERAEASGAAATVAPLWHSPGPDVPTNLATARYEASLRYYVLGLRAAGSAFAFHTVGSLISVRASAYAAVRGFPRREAGEDFYLLAKLAKIGEVCSLGGAPVELRSRRSTRAPFGTGPAVEAQLRRGGGELEVYDPRVFACLGRVLASLEDVAARSDFTALTRLAAEFEDLAELDHCLRVAQRAQREFPLAQLRGRLRESFDAFRTLKLVHALTRARWPKLPWSEAVAAAPFLPFSAGLDIDEQRARLLSLEAVRAT